MTFKKYFILSCLIVSSLVVFSQNSQTTYNLDLDNKYILLKKNILLADKSIVPINFHLERNKLPFFCDLEVKLEASTKIPVKFRLGEVQTVERKEGKY